jgi:flagellar basal-body rod protein FlgB
MFAMDLAGIPLFAMLRSRLGYLSNRERVIAENVSNADTPGYGARDLKPFSFDVKMQAQAAAGVQATTEPNHMTAPNAKRDAYRSKRTPDSETTLDGNSVVLEEEMLKMSDARTNYDAAISFYQKSLNLLQLAARAPGHS